MHKITFGGIYDDSPQIINIFKTQTINLKKKMPSYKLKLNKDKIIISATGIYKIDFRLILSSTINNHITIFLSNNNNPIIDTKINIDLEKDNDKIVTGTLLIKLRRKDIIKLQITNNNLNNEKLIIDDAYLIITKLK